MSGLSRARIWNPRSKPYYRHRTKLAIPRFLRLSSPEKNHRGLLPPRSRIELLGSAPYGKPCREQPSHIIVGHVRANHVTFVGTRFYTHRKKASALGTNQKFAVYLKLIPFFLPMIQALLCLLVMAVRLSTSLDKAKIGNATSLRCHENPNLLHQTSGPQISVCALSPHTHLLIILRHVYHPVLPRHLARRALLSLISAIDLL